MTNDFNKKKIFLICSAGGHLTQLLRLSRELKDYPLLLITEKTKISVSIREKQFHKIYYLPHGGREKKFLFVYKFSINCFLSIYRIFKYKPKIIITTGAHTAVPTCYFAKLIGARIIYIETFAKIKSPSLAGRLVYPISDSFYVQWPLLNKYYPKAKYVGKIY